MTSFREKPVGWRNESYRHYLAQKGISTSRRYRVVNWNVDDARRRHQYIMWMTPDEYLRSTHGRSDEPEEETHMKRSLQYYGDIEEKEQKPIRLLVEKMKAGKEIEMPFLVGREQEGRHRAYAAELAGEKVIPVRIDRPIHHRTEELAREFVKRAGFRDDDSYAREWVGRFERGYPEEYMGPEYKEIFHTLLQERGLTKRDVEGEGFVAKDVEGGEPIRLKVVDKSIEKPRKK